LTTKMLASTVQFSTNAQPTTTTHATNHPQRVCYTRRPCLPNVRSRKTKPHPHQGGNPSPHPREGKGLFLQDPTGCLRHTSSRTNHPVPEPHRGPVLEGSAVAGGGLPVSPPIEQPHPHIRRARAPDPPSRVGAP
jgi:hypothetical protein